jgi:hypothetical protein
MIFQRVTQRSLSHVFLHVLSELITSLFIGKGIHPTLHNHKVKDFHVNPCAHGI